MKNEDCVFCKIAQGKMKGEIIESSNNFIAVKDAHPKTQGHTLVIPKRHFVNLLDIPNKLGNELLEFTKKIASKMLDNKQGDGFNIIMNNLQVAGQLVMHAHIHIIPRKEGDGVKTLV